MRLLVLIGLVFPGAAQAYEVDLPFSRPGLIRPAASAVRPAFEALSARFRARRSPRAAQPAHRPSPRRGEFAAVRYLMSCA